MRSERDAAAAESALARGDYRAAWLSVAETARLHGVGALCINGGVLRGADDVSATGNVLYDLVSAEAVDGVLVWSSCLDWAVAPEAMQAFCDRFRPLPVVSAAHPGCRVVVGRGDAGWAAASTHWRWIDLKLTFQAGVEASAGFSC